jgi:hypothetical protein
MVHSVSNVPFAQTNALPGTLLVEHSRRDGAAARLAARVDDGVGGTGEQGTRRWFTAFQTFHSPRPTPFPTRCLWTIPRRGGAVARLAARVDDGVGGTGEQGTRRWFTAFQTFHSPRPTPFPAPCWWTIRPGPFPTVGRTALVILVGGNQDRLWPSVRLSGGCGS